MYHCENSPPIETRQTALARQNQSFELDFSEQTLTSDQGCIRLRAKLWQLFILLLKSQGRLVSREQLIDQLWDGNYYTGPCGLNHSICHLRRIMGQLELSWAITTIPKRGYILSRRKSALSIDKSTRRLHFNLPPSEPTHSRSATPLEIELEGLYRS